MPQRLVDNFESVISDEELHDGSLGYNILSDDLDGEDALLLNICVYRRTHLAVFKISLNDM